MNECYMDFGKRFGKVKFQMSAGTPESKCCASFVSTQFESKYRQLTV